MNRGIERVVLCLGLLLALGAAIGAQSTSSGTSGAPSGTAPRRFAWWRSEQYQKNLGLTPDQVNRVEAVFQGVFPHLQKGRDELDRQEDALSRLIALETDEAQVTRQVDKVEAIRADLNKKRTLLLFHMYQVLTPDQRVRLRAALNAEQAARDRAARPQDEHKP